MFARKPVRKVANIPHQMALNIEKVSKRYGNNWALRDIELEIASGEIFGIYGGNGSGKTALLKVIAGIEKANGGAITLTENLSNSECYLFEGEQSSGLTSIFHREKESGADGEKRVRKFRQALDRPERVLLFDDPFCGVDALERDALLSQMNAMAKEKGKTVIFASSDFEQIAAICDRVAVIVKGEIAQVGFPQEIYQNPASRSVAVIVGRNNIFTARRLTSTNADLPEFQTIEGSHRLYAKPTAKHALGAINQNVSLSIRPEQVSISFEAAFPEDNILKAVVTGIRFLGSTTIIELNADGLRLESRVFRVVGLNVGDECMIAMPPHRIQVLKD